MPAAVRPVLVVIGPPGSGKSSMVRELHRRHVLRVHPTWTTRPRRTDERAGSLEHRFVSEARFDQLRVQGFFQDTGRLFGLPYQYGLPPLRSSQRGPIDAVMLRAPFVGRFGEMVSHRLVYQIQDDAERVRSRLVARGIGPRELAARLTDNRREIEGGHAVADRIFVNGGTLEELIEAVATALHADTAAARPPDQSGDDR